MNGALVASSSEASTSCHTICGKQGAEYARSGQILFHITNNIKECFRSKTSYIFSRTLSVLLFLSGLYLAEGIRFSCRRATFHINILV